MADENADYMEKLKIFKKKSDEVKKTIVKAVEDQDWNIINAVRDELLLMIKMLHSLSRSMSDDEVNELMDPVSNIIQELPWKSVRSIDDPRLVNDKIFEYVFIISRIPLQSSSSNTLHMLTKLAEVFCGDDKAVHGLQPSTSQLYIVINMLNPILKKICVLKYYLRCSKISLKKIEILKKFVDSSTNAFLESPEYIMNLEEISTGPPRFDPKNYSSCLKFLKNLDKELCISLHIFKVNFTKTTFMQGTMTLEFFPGLTNITKVSELLPDDSNARELCAVCHDVIGKNFAILDNCNHNFCWECLKPWANIQ